MSTNHATEQPSLWIEGEQLKRCNVCSEKKPLTEFGWRKADATHRGGKRGECRECCRIYAAKYNKRRGPQRKDQYRRKQAALYGLTSAQFWAMHANQGGLCAICGKPETRMRRETLQMLAIDHDHKTGKVRDLLCGSCNRMLGQGKDRPDLLRAGADYLDRHS